MNTKTSPKDFFLHLGAVIVLYVVAGALINLAFSVINYAYPDQLATYFYAPSMVWPISLLIVLIPVLYLLEWFIARDFALNPEKKALPIRKLRIYLTIFLGAALIIGDIIALLNTYLSGEITARFVWKILAILLIAGCAGKYYFFSLYENFRWAKLIRRGNAWFGIILVIVAIVSGFVIVGSPAKQRGLRFDSQRESDLSNIQSRVVNYWQQKGALPAALSDLNDMLYGSIIPTDPDTASAYEYRTVAATSSKDVAFELCATFSLPSQDLTGRGAYGGGTGVSYPSTVNMTYPYPGMGNDSWDHQAGHACFTRTIDPQMYPVFPKAVAAPVM